MTYRGRKSPLPPPLLATRSPSRLPPVPFLQSSNQKAVLTDRGGAHPRPSQHSGADFLRHLFYSSVFCSKKAVLTDRGRKNPLPPLLLAAFLLSPILAPFNSLPLLIIEFQMSRRCTYFSLTQQDQRILTCFQMRESCLAKTER